MFFSSRLLTLLLAVVTLFLTSALPIAAEVLLEQAPIETRLAHLFVDHRDAKSFHYIPKTPRVATWPNGKPKFTFLQYAKTGSEEAGGLLHFLVNYGLTPEELQATERELQRVVKGGKVLGPVPFVEGTFAIISATAGPESANARRIVGTGKAPLLAGQDAAVSIALTQTGSSLLLESFKKQTSDVSVQFILTYEGLTAPFEAVLEVDWEKVYKHKSLNVTGGIALFTAQIKKAYEELTESGAIRLEVLGDDVEMEALLNTAYATLTKMMFEARPVGPKDLGKVPSQKTSWVTRLFGGAKVGYYKLESHYTGTYRVDMRRRKRDRREIPITGNLGDIYRRFADDKEMFDFVDLDNTPFDERTVQVILDGEDLASFADFINFAGVEFRRQHDQDDAVTTGTALFDRASFSADTKRPFTYLRKQDGAGWLRYDHRKIWSFRGGVEVRGEWTSSQSSLVVLSPPYRYRYIEVLADESNFEEHDLLRVAVHFRHRFQDTLREDEIVLRAGEPLNDYHTYLTAPETLEYEFRLTFLRRDGKRFDTPWRSRSDPFLYAYFDPTIEDPSAVSP